jgi:hypothetical protein
LRRANEASHTAGLNMGRRNSRINVCMLKLSGSPCSVRFLKWSSNVARENSASLWATYKQLDVAALVRTAGTCGRGEGVCSVPAGSVRVCVKPAKSRK